MRRLLIACLIAVLAMPASAQQRQPARPAPPAAPLNSAWNGTSLDFQNRFNEAARRAGLRLRIEMMICEVAPRLECEADAGGVTIWLRGRPQPEQVTEAAIAIPRGGSHAIVLSAAHLVMDIVEPTIPAEERRAAVLGFTGAGGAPRHHGGVGHTQLAFRLGRGLREDLVASIVPSR